MDEKIKRVNRRRFYVDSKVQSVLIGRVILYWILSTLLLGIITVCWMVITDPLKMSYLEHIDMWFFVGPICVVSVMVLPLIVIDVIRISNRFVGPILRLRRSMRDLAQGKNVDPITFRRDDFWRDFADDFNAVRAHLLHITEEKENINEDEFDEPLAV
jgi:hypothetical protein